MGLMLLPVAALGIWAWRGGPTKPTKPGAPTRIVVRSVKFQSLMAREIGQGFDTKVLITLGYEGQKPRKWGPQGPGLSHLGVSLSPTLLVRGGAVRVPG